MCASTPFREDAQAQKYAISGTSLLANDIAYSNKYDLILIYLFNRFY